MIWARSRETSVHRRSAATSDSACRCLVGTHPPRRWSRRRGLVAGAPRRERV